MLVAVSILLSLWVIIGQSVFADQNPSGMDYEKIDNSKILITGYSGTESNLTFTSFPEYDNPSVSIEIDQYAFKGNTTIESIAFPSNVTMIGEGAFAGCVNLKTVGLSATKIDQIANETFDGCVNLIAITSLPDTVVSVGNFAFRNCTSLDAFTIGPNMTSIAGDAFEGCTGLIAMDVDGENEMFSTYKGAVTYSNNGTVLTDVLSENEYTNGEMTATHFNPSCTEIANGAFSGTRNITTVVLPSSITTIQAGAFDNSSVTTITIPPSVTFIGSQSNWGVLEVVYGYAGSEAQRFAERHTGTLNGRQTKADFVVVGNASGNNNNNTNYDNNNNTNYNNNNNNYNNSNNNNNYNNSNNSNNINAPADPTSPGLNTNVNGDGTNGDVINGGGSVNVVNGKDSTPRTADGDIDARWFLIMGCFLAGIAVIFFSRIRKMELVTVKKESDLDS